MTVAEGPQPVLSQPGRRRWPGSRRRVSTTVAQVSTMGVSTTPMGLKLSLESPGQVRCASLIHATMPNRWATEFKHAFSRLPSAAERAGDTHTAAPGAGRDPPSFECPGAALQRAGLVKSKDRA